MSDTSKLPIAHLVNPEPASIHSKTLIEMLEHGSADQVVLTFLDRQHAEEHRTYADLLEGARGAANYLKNRGLKPGDKVILLLLTGEQFIDAFFGTILAGGIPVAVSPPLTFGDIGKYLLNIQHVRWHLLHLQQLQNCAKEKRLMYSNDCLFITSRKGSVIFL